MKTYELKPIELKKEKNEKYRRHSKKHIIKLFNKLQNGEVLDITYSNCNGDGSLSVDARYYMNDKFIIIMRVGYYSNGDILFNYNNVDEFIEFFNKYKHLAPTYYIKILNKEE